MFKKKLPNAILKLAAIIENSKHTRRLIYTLLLLLFIIAICSLAVIVYFIHKVEGLVAAFVPVAISVRQFVKYIKKKFT